VQLPAVLVAPGLDRAAFAALYERSAEDLLVFFACRTLDPQIARDLWAETYAQAFAGRRRFRGRDAEQARSWLYGIAYRQLALYHRRGKAERRAMERLGLQQPAFADDDVARLIELADLRAQRARLAGALGRLSPTLRAAVELRIVGELPYEEVAERLGVSEQTARARVSRGLRSLQRDAVLEVPAPTNIEVTS
jgi:RNA polymerase sigma-70 factor (ECF subfamily)